MLTMAIGVPQGVITAARERLAPALFQKRAESAMEEATAMLQGLVEAGTPVDRGILRGSIFHSVTGTPFLGVTGRVAPGIAAKDYASVMELGRKPGTMPPVEAIAAWVRRKGIAGIYSVKSHRRLHGNVAQQSEDMRAAWAIAISIKLHGIKGHFMFRDAMQRGAPVVQAIFLKWFSK